MLHGMAGTRKGKVETVGHRQASGAKRAAILEATAALFLDSGYLGVSMGQIAESAGVAEQTVYSHFTSGVDLRQSLKTYGTIGSTSRSGSMAPRCDNALCARDS